MAKVKDVVAYSISSFDNAADRLKFTSYLYDSAAGANTATVVAADFSDISSDSSDIVKGGDAFKVVGIAEFVGAAEGAMGSSGVGGYNLTARPTKFDP